MNLHKLVRSGVGTVNPYTLVTIQRSTGNTIAPDGSQVPSYAAPVTVRAHRQPMATTDLMQVQGLNLTGIKCKLYLDGNWDGVIRADQRGGDLVTMPDGSIWLVVMVLENWSEQDGWTSVALTLQDGT
nr:hypothetical protein [uncultured Lichenicoccus sp.]